MLCTYTGTDSRMYPSYRDATTGRTLEVQPGGTYDVEVISGHAPGLPLPPGDGRWAPATTSKDAPEVPPAELPPPLPPPVPAVKPVAPVPSEAGGSPADKER